MSVFVRGRFALLLLLVTVTVAGCGLTIPTDPDGTLDRVQDGTLRVGVSLSAPWTTAGSHSEPEGIEVDLARTFAGSLGAQVEWSVAGEEALVLAMENGDLDLIIGGLTSTSAWADKVALTMPYRTTTDDTGKKHDHVMAVPMGENAFLVELETFLREEG